MEGVDSGAVMEEVVVLVEGGGEEVLQEGLITGFWYLDYHQLEAGRI